MDFPYGGVMTCSIDPPLNLLKYVWRKVPKAPMVVRGMIGAGFSAAVSAILQSPYNVFAGSRLKSCGSI